MKRCRWRWWFFCVMNIFRIRSKCCIFSFYDFFGFSLFFRFFWFFSSKFNLPVIRIFSGLPVNEIFNISYIPNFVDKKTWMPKKNFWLSIHEMSYILKSLHKNRKFIHYVHSFLFTSHKFIVKLQRQLHLIKTRWIGTEKNHKSHSFT